MITESFLDNCFKYLCSVPIGYKKSKELFSTMNEILIMYGINNEKFNKFNFNNEINPSFNDKYEFIKFFSKFRSSNCQNFDMKFFIDIISVGRFSSYADIIPNKIEETSDLEIDNFLTEFIIPKKLLYEILVDREGFKKLLNDIEHNNFDDQYEVIEKWINEIQKHHNNILNIKRTESIKDAICLDLLNDDYEPALERYRSNTLDEGVIVSGFSLFDESFPHGGFEKRRLYIFGGETGVGKSVLLQNILTNTVKHPKNLSRLIEDTEKQKVHLFITAENLIDESLIRFYCSSTGKVHKDIVHELKENNAFSIKSEITKILKESNSNILFYYVQSRVATLSDIETLIENVREKYSLESLFIDYLDLIRSGTETEMRHELGEVTLGFKRFAVNYNIPVITVTQLNRTGYGANGPATLTSMSESMRKANDADFVAFLQNHKDNYIKFTNDMGEVVEGTPVRVTVLKNRNGTTGHYSNLFLTKKIDGEDKFNYRFIEMPRVPESEIAKEDFSDDLFE